MGKHSYAPKVFSRPELHNDVFEVVVDVDLSGGPLIEQFDPTRELSERAAHSSIHGVTPRIITS
jgi:hypothetical protein